MGCIVINFYTRERTELHENTETPIETKPKRQRKPKTPPVDESVKQFFRDSLDNERVKQKYKLTPKD